MDDEDRKALAARLHPEIALDLAQSTDDAADRQEPEAHAVRGRHLINVALRREGAERIARGDPPMKEDDEDAIAQLIWDELFAMGPLERWLADESVENVNANGCDVVWVTRADGSKERVAPLADSDEALIGLIQTTARRAGLTERRFDPGSPALNLRLPDGSRLFAIMSVARRPAVSIRRHRHPRTTLRDLVRLGTIDEGLHDFLSAAVRARKNIIVCGGTGVGKTTLLRALLHEVDPAERVVTIEDSFELGLDEWPERHPDVVALEAREPNVEGHGEVTMAALVRHGLRMSPDRVIVGEVRGAEVLPMLNAMSQGNDGSMCTLHADSSVGAFSRLAMYAVQAPERLPLEATNLLVANAVHFVVFLGQDCRGAGESPRRYVASVREVSGADGPRIVSNEVFAPGPHGLAVPAAQFRPATIEALERAGMRAPRHFEVVR